MTNVYLTLGKTTNKTLIDSSDSALETWRQNISIIRTCEDGGCSFFSDISYIWLLGEGQGFPAMF